MSLNQAKTLAAIFQAVGIGIGSILGGAGALWKRLRCFCLLLSLETKVGRQSAETGPKKRGVLFGLLFYNSAPCYFPRGEPQVL